MASFGDNLKRYRMNNNFSQAELAELVGMHCTHISRYERKITKPTLEVIKKFAESLKVSTDQLIYGESERVKVKINDQELLRMFTRVQSLRKDDVHCIKSMLNAYILKTDMRQNYQRKSTK